MLRHIKNLLLMAFLLAITTPIEAQTSTLIHLGKPYYVTGEIVNYKIYFPAYLATKSPMLKLQIYNGDGELVNQSYLKKKSKNHINGHYRIPYEAKSGLYTLVVSSLEEITSTTKNLGRISLAIFSDNESVPVTSNTLTDYEQDQKSKPTELKVSMKIQSLQVRPRELVNLEIEIRDLEGNPIQADMSLVITDIGILGKEGSNPYTNIGDCQVSFDPDVYLSEYIPFSGKLANNSDDQLITFFMPSQNRIYYTTSAVSGEFQLLIPEFYGEQTLQYIGAFSDSTSMELDKPVNIDSSPDLIYTESVVEYIKSSRVRKIIYQLYNRVENATSYEIPKITEMAAPDRLFKASDYPFESMLSFCKELSTPLKFVKNKLSEDNFKMFNPESRNFYFGNPLFIVNGQLTKDVEYLSKLDFQSIDEIGLYYDNQRLSDNFGFAGFSGVVIVTSKEGNLGVPVDPSTQVFQLSGIQPNILDPQEIWTVEEPVLKPQLVWEPTLDTNSRGHLEYSFQQSDDISLFQIEVVVQSEDGRRGVGKLEYRVTN